MSRRNQILILSLASLTFFVLGGLTASLGPALPGLASQTNSPLEQMGIVYTGLFLGALVSQLISGVVSDRFGQRPLQMIGQVLVAGGILGISLSHSYILLFACSIFTGLGHGAVDVGGNLMVAEAFPNKRASALNLLNVFFGLGAFAGPAIAGLTLRIWSTALPVLWGGAILLAAMIPLVPFAVHARSAHPLEAPHEPANGLYTSPLLWILGALVLVYVGVENGMGGWTTSYLTTTTGMDISLAALATSGFWMALTVGRVVGTVLGTRVDSLRLLAFSLALSALAGILLVMGVGSAALSMAAILLLGFGYGPVYPTAFAITSTTFRHRMGAATSVTVAMGSIGGMLVPWVQGLLLGRIGPAASVYLIAVGGGVMLFALWLYHLRTQPANSRVSTT